MNKKYTVIFLIVLTLFFMGFFLGPPVFIAKMNTEYAQGYSHENLLKIKLGLSKNEVTKRLGKYMNTYGQRLECWNYSRAKNKWSDITGWESIVVCFDKNGKVSGVGDNIFFN